MSDLSVIYKIAGDITGLTTAVNRGADATEQLAGKVSKAGSTILSSLTAAFSVAAITGAIAKYTELTSSLTDLELKTGIGAEALQRLKYAAEQNGSSLDAVTAAVSKLGKNLAGEDKSAKGALDALGLSFQDIRTSAPDVAFAKIGDAIAKIEDPMARSKLAMDLFGKSGAELLPVLTNHLSETAAEADKLGIVMSEDAVQAGDKFGDSMHALELVGQSLIGRVLTPLVPILTELSLWLGENLPKAISGAQGAFDFIIKAVLELRVGMLEFFLTIAEAAEKIPGLGRLLGNTSFNVKTLSADVQHAKDVVNEFTTSTAASTKVVDTHSKSMASLNLNYDEQAKATDKSKKAIEELAQAELDLQEETDRVFAAMQAQIDKDQAAQLASQIMEAGFQINLAFLHTADSIVAAGNDINASLESIRQNELSLGNQITAAGVDIDNAQQRAAASVKSHGIAWQGLANQVSGNLTQMLMGTQSFSDTMKNIWHSLINELLGSFVNKFIKGAINSLLGSGPGMTQGFQGMFGGLGKTLSSAMSSITGWAAAAAMAVQGVMALVNHFRGGEEGTVVNPERDKWFGGRGVQDVGDQLGAAGHGGEEARQLIQAVFDAKTDAQFKQASSAIDQLTGGARGVLPGEHDFGDVPVLGSGGILTQPRLAVVGDVPEAVIPLDRLSQIAGAGSGSDVPVVLMLDGRELARAFIPMLPGELRRLRLA